MNSYDTFTLISSNERGFSVIVSAAKNPAGGAHAAALLDSSLTLRMTNPGVKA